MSSKPSIISSGRIHFLGPFTFGTISLNLVRSIMADALLLLLLLLLLFWENQCLFKINMPQVSPLYI